VGFAIFGAIALLQVGMSIVHLQQRITRIEIDGIFHHLLTNNTRTVPRGEDSDAHFYEYNASLFTKNYSHSKDSIRIHYYNKQFWLKTTVLDKCEYKCHLTWGRERYTEADFVIFFGPRIGSKEKPPTKKPGQTWIYHSKESITNFPSLNKSWRFKFNWTMTIRRDSDSTTYNGFIKNISRADDIQNLKELWKTKDKEAAWFVSNCGGQSKRKDYAKALAKYINIDIYGSCGNFKCPRHKEEECFNNLKKRYKLYMAFENSLCFDYITEKGYNIYDRELDVIPVVRGLLNDQYRIYFPPGSYISTDDFSSVEELSKYLKKVTQDFDLFSKYMKWKQFYKAYFSFPIEFCKICEKAHKAYKYKRIYSDLNLFERWGDDKKVCRDVTDIPRKGLSSFLSFLWKLLSDII